MKEFVRENGYTFPMLIDLNEQVAKKFSVKGHPHSILIKKNGELVGSVTGARNWESNEVLNYFERMLKY